MDWEGKDSVAYLAIRGSQVWLNKEDTETLVKYLLELLAFPSFYNNFHRDNKNPNKPYVL